MDIDTFKAGRYVKADDYFYFLPEKINHTFSWRDESISELLERASFKLGELNSFSQLVPDIDMFILMHSSKEAVLSNRIEGTRTDIEQVFIEEEEIGPQEQDDRQEIINYIKAMEQSLIELKKLPLSNRLIRKAHKLLLASGRGKNKQPGQFRRSQNWIGGATLKDAVFIPPHSKELPELLSDLELFLHNNKIKVPHLIRIAIAHYQFETIHPFQDGNGRIGRLLITLYLVASGLLSKPLLYLSAFLEKHRSLYYDNLDIVRTKNALGRWIKFFLTGVAQTAEDSVMTLNKIIKLKDTIEKKKIVQMGKRSRQGMELLQQLFKQPLVTIKEIQSMNGLSPKAANNLAQAFVAQEILYEKTGYQRNRIFVFEEYLDMFR